MSSRLVEVISTQSERRPDGLVETRSNDATPQIRGLLYLTFSDKPRVTAPPGKELSCPLTSAGKVKSPREVTKTAETSPRPHKSFIGLPIVTN